MVDWTNYPNFTAEEVFKCRETGETCPPNEELLRKLQTMRRLFGKPLIVNSGYRSPRHSIEAAKASPGVHTRGMAVDIRALAPETAYRLVELAYTVGFSGIGISRPPKAGYIHLDISPRKAIWTY